MFSGEFEVTKHGTVMYTSDGVTYRVDWWYGIGQVWLGWPDAVYPVREDVLWQVMG